MLKGTQQTFASTPAPTVHSVIVPPSNEGDNGGITIFRTPWGLTPDRPAFGGDDADDRRRRVEAASSARAGRSGTTIFGGERREQ